MSKTRYSVTGDAPFKGHRPGEQFEAELDPDVERRAVARGSIKVVKRGDNDKGEEGKKDV